MDVTGTNLRAWENFWRDAPDGPGGVFWDAEAEVTAALHLPLFEAHFDPSLPVVDLGCGNGTQTRFLAERYGRAVGVDLAAAAIGHARQQDPDGVAEYRRLNAADLDAVRRLGGELGEVNVYMRGVLHQCLPEERAPLVEGIALLTGGRGRVFADEPAESAKGVLGGLAQGPGGPPAKLAAVFAHGIAPAEMPDETIPELFRAAGMEVLARGEAALVTTERRADGSRIEVPTNWLVAGGAG
ncbi:class I SAM-dependent methyltransferase [Streptomyces sp. NPDC026673]|uniref:class I SAM-dependent methyltransferase n=1 Tax=Streptomyces sp. NPDC026673 TaxID=3155724 RepID=UPI0033FB83EA